MTIIMKEYAMIHYSLVTNESSNRREFILSNRIRRIFWREERWNIEFDAFFWRTAFSISPTMTAAAVDPDFAATSTSSQAAAELIRAISATNRTSGRRSCTILLNRWKKEILPNISRSTLFELLVDTGGGGGDAITITASDYSIPYDGINRPPILTPFTMVLNQDDDFSTEGHREASVEILKDLFRCAFGGVDIDKDDTSAGLEAVQENRFHVTLLRVYHHFAQIFQKQMSHHNAPSNDRFHHGTMTEPLESSEHIRLLLVELMVDLGGYCLASNRKEYFPIGYENYNKMMIDATSIICHTLAKSTFLDPYPEIPRAACDLVQLLAQLCPLAVRMNAKSLLMPLTGISNDSIGGSVEQPTASTSLSISKRCLMRHRHAKTRCQAVHASVGIVLCCPRMNACMQIKDKIADDLQSVSANHLSNRGSHSISMEHILQHNILPEWGNLLTLDSSASVKLAVLNSLGTIANNLEWRHFPGPTITSQTPTESSTDAGIRSLPSTNVTTVVEARVLTLILSGMSNGSVADVRSLAVRKLRDLTGEGILPRNILVSYFVPMLDLILCSCSDSWTVCQSRVGSLETLQVLLCISIPLMNEGSSDPSDCLMMLGLPDATIHAIVNVLSMNLLSDEKEVVEAAFTCCHALGANDFMVTAILKFLCDPDNLGASVTDDASCGEVAVQPNESKVDPSPRTLTSHLLIIDGLLKGFVNANDGTSILREVDNELAAPTPNWFRSSSSPSMDIGRFFCHTTITKTVASSSSLAWALVDACDSFVKCVQYSNISLSENIIINVLVGVAYLVGCPIEYGISSKALDIHASLSLLEECSPPDSTCEEKGLSFLDVHFRKVFIEITSNAPQFPWKQSEPALRAIDALLRSCNGYIVGSNFDLVAPFFMSHLSNMQYSSNSNDGANSENQSDGLAEDYSLRISLMALLQTILADDSFAQTQQCKAANAACTTSAQFTTDLILSLVIPNLVWRVGGMASALRKLALATLFSLLIAGPAFIHSDTLACLIPTLHSSFDDSESSVRELSCVCLSLTLQHIPIETFSATQATNPQAIDTIIPRLLELLDDNHGPVRIAACNCLRSLYPLVQSNIPQSSHETINASLLIHLDDPDANFQAKVFQTLMELVDYQRNGSEVDKLLERQIIASMKSHRDEARCQELLAKLAEF